MTTTNKLNVPKTYKVYINGQFPRSESGRTQAVVNSKGVVLANICLCSRKDVKDAVVAARKAFGSWKNRSAFNRSQILYRIAEMLNGRRTQFMEELICQGLKKIQAEKEVDLAINRLVYYSGWCDKYQQIFSCVNPVASSHFNFSVLEPTGVVAAVVPQSTSLIGLISIMAPIIAGGNTCVLLASESKPLCSITFAEVLNSSDLPSGVVNVLTGKVEELLIPLCNHMDINAVCFAENNLDSIALVQENAATNIKRTIFYNHENWMQEQTQSPYFIQDFQELKTIWHPIEKIGGSTGGY